MRRANRPRIQMNLRIARETARWLRVYAAQRDMSPGAVIDEMVERQQIVTQTNGGEKNDNRAQLATI